MSNTPNPRALRDLYERLYWFKRECEAKQRAEQPRSQYRAHWIQAPPSH